MLFKLLIIIYCRIVRNRSAHLRRHFGTGMYIILRHDKQLLLCTRSQQTFLVKNQRVNILDFAGCMVLSQLLNSATIAWNQQWTKHKWMRVAGFQRNPATKPSYLQKQKHATFGLKAIIYQPMSQVREKYMMHPQTFNTGESPKKDF